MTKSPKKSLFVKGGAQGPGRGPKPGAANAGRPNDEFKEFLKSIRDSEKFRQRLRDIAELSDPMTFMKLASWIVERTDGKPVQAISNADDKPFLIVGL